VVALLAAAAFCTAPQLRPSLELQGATGSLRGGVFVRNRGRTCTFATTGADVRGRAFATGVDWAPSRNSILPAGRAVWVPVVWRNWCGGPLTSFTLHLRGGGTLAMRAIDAPRCDAPSRPTDLKVGRPRLVR
jgi:hypothetical protein